MGGMMSISVEAAAARDSLSNDKELIHTYEVDFFFFDLSINTLIGCPNGNTLFI